MSEMASGLPVPANEPGQALQTPVSADTVQLVTRIERAIKQRRDSDTELMNYWLYFFLVSWVTFGIYGLVLFFKRISRIDGFTARKRDYYRSLIDWTERYAEERSTEDQVHHELSDLREDVQAAYKGDLREIKAGIS